MHRGIIDSRDASAESRKCLKLDFAIAESPCRVYIDCIDASYCIPFRWPLCVPQVGSIVEFWGPEAARGVVRGAGIK